jgi:hypothetical protein
MPKARLALVPMLMLASPLYAQPAPQGAIHFNCPKAGTIEQRRLGSIHYEGSAPNDVFVCKRLDYLNRPYTLLFNYFGTLNNADNTQLRSAMTDLLSFNKPVVSFTQTSDHRFIHNETWSYLRKERIKIGTMMFNTIVLRQDDEQTTGNRLHQIVDHWLDPVNGLWLKQTFTYVSGQVTGGVGNYLAVAITLP